MIQKIIKVAFVIFAFVLAIISSLLTLNYQPKVFTEYQKKGYWTDYSLLQVCTPSHWHQPSSVLELRNLIKHITENKEKLKVVAAAHSMSSIAMTNGHLINLDKINKVIKVDKEKKQVTVQAGIRLKQLTEFLATQNLSLKNVGQILEQSIGGAMSTSTHGSTAYEKGTKKFIHGSISTQIIELEIIDSKGNLHRASATENKDLFDAARCGLGALGVITQVTIQCVDAFHLERHETSSTVFEVVDNLDKYLSNNDYFRFWWVPYTNISKILSFKKTEKPKNLSPISEFIQQKLEVPILITILSIGRVIGYPNIFQVLVEAIKSEKSIIQRSDLALTGPVTDKYTEMEYFVPFERFKEAHEAIRKYITESPVQYNFINENRFIKGDDIWLSPYYGRDSASISIVIYDQDKVWEEYAKGAEKVFMKFEGRPHFGKVNFRTAKDLKHQFEKWNDFLRVRKMMDSESTFMNDYLEKLLYE